MELYATGIASKEEVILVDKYVADYPEVAAELSGIINSLEAYANSFSIQPDASVKDKIFSRIGELSDNKLSYTENVFYNGSKNNLSKNGELAKLIPVPSYWKFAAAASIVLLIGSVSFNISLFNKTSDSNKKLQQTQQELAVLKKDSKLTDEGIQIVQNKFSRPVSLRGLEASPNAAAKIFWIENTGELYIDPSNLPDAPAGKQYQLWGIVDGKPVDAGMIKTLENKDKFRIQKMRSFGKAEAFAVTLENEAGNKSPKGPMFVMGKM